MMTPACVRGGTVRAAHPRFESALNVSDAPLRVTLGLGNAQTHTCRDTQITNQNMLH